VISLLEKRGAEYAIKVPFYEWVGLKPLIAERKRWTRVDATVDCFEKQLRIQTWQRTMRVVIYRRRVRHEAPKNYQLDLFDPADGHYEYSAIVTNKDLTGAYLWHYMCGRGSHEKRVRRAQGRRCVRLPAVAALRRQQRVADAERACVQPDALDAGRDDE